MKQSDFIVIGAGMGGTSCGYWLSQDHSIQLLEMESQPGYHTTGRSVAIYTEAYGPRTIRALAKSGYEFLTRPPVNFTNTPLSRPVNWVFVARKDQRQHLESGLAAVKELSPQIDEISVEQAIRMVPILRKDYVDSAMLEPNSLSLDVSAIHQGFIRGIKANGGAIECNAEVLNLERKQGFWHVETRAGTFSAKVVINAAGAWADKVATAVGANPVGLQPKRRTVVAFVPSNVTISNDWPLVIDIEEQFYFKIDAGTVLGSPGDETPVPPQDVQPEELDVAVAIDRLERATTMKVDTIQRTWAGLRSFVEDGVPVVGYDPEVEDFFWCAGQGGYGIETCYGMGRSSAWLATGRGLPEDVTAMGVTEQSLSPRRFI